VPWGVTDQDDFLNAVLIVEDSVIDAYGWFRRGLDLEARAGRRRAGRWGPRTLDIDVITVDGVRSVDSELTLPHPGAATRPTVLLPWADIEPEAVLPGAGPIRELLAATVTTGCIRRDDLRLERR
jgi:2-amino-4-hydroxy-6-hydroxymethyldihydropteridine diphosphokinase